MGCCFGSRLRGAAGCCPAGARGQGQPGTLRDTNVGPRINPAASARVSGEALYALSGLQHIWHYRLTRHSKEALLIKHVKRYSSNPMERWYLKLISMGSKTRRWIKTYNDHPPELHLFMACQVTFVHLTVTVLKKRLHVQICSK